MSEPRHMRHSDARPSVGIASDGSVWEGTDMVLVRRFDGKNAQAEAIDKLTDPERYTVPLAPEREGNRGISAVALDDGSVLLRYRRDGDEEPVFIDKTFLEQVRAHHQTFELRQDGHRLNPIGCFDAGMLLAVLMPRSVTR